MLDFCPFLSQQSKKIKASQNVRHMTELDAIHPFEEKSCADIICNSLCVLFMATHTYEQPHQIFPLSGKQRSHVVKQGPLRLCNVVSTVMPLMPSYATPPLFSGSSDSDKGDRQQCVITVQPQ